MQASWGYGDLGCRARFSASRESTQTADVSAVVVHSSVGSGGRGKPPAAEQTLLTAARLWDRQSSTAMKRVAPVGLEDAKVEPAVPVSDMAEAQEFYETKLGLSGGRKIFDGGITYPCG